jgi:hypothetical protein
VCIILFESAKAYSKSQTFQPLTSKEEPMRNTTMQDALTAILCGANAELESQSNEAVLSAERATRRKLSKTGRSTTRAISGASKDKAELLDSSPRYIDPRRKNPFAVHVHPVVAILKPPAEPELAVQQSERLDLPPKTKPCEIVPPPQIPNLVSEPEVAIEAKSIPISEKQPETLQPVLVPATKEALVEEKPQLETSALPETPVIDSEYEDVEDAPAVVLPSNLEWLKKPTPFASNLTAIVDELRDARQRVIFTLEQYQARQKELRKQLDAAEYGIKEEKENLCVLDDNISACALVAEQSANLKPGLLVVNQIHHRHLQKEAGAPRTPRRWSVDDVTMCHQKDIVRFFEANPNMNWTATEITKALPAAKHAHAKTHLNIILAALNKTGEIRRVTKGVYRVDKTVVSEQEAE